MKLISFLFLFFLGYSNIVFAMENAPQSAKRPQLESCSTLELIKAIQHFENIKSLYSNKEIFLNYLPPDLRNMLYDYLSADIANKISAFVDQIKKTIPGPLLLVYSRTLMDEAEFFKKLKIEFSKLPIKDLKMQFCLLKEIASQFNFDLHYKQELKKCRYSEGNYAKLKNHNLNETTLLLKLALDLDCFWGLEWLKNVCEQPEFSKNIKNLFLELLFDLPLAQNYICYLAKLMPRIVDSKENLFNMPPLFYALEELNFEVVKLLLKLNADSELCGQGITLLSKAESLRDVCYLNEDTSIDDIIFLIRKKIQANQKKLALDSNNRFCRIN